MKVKFIIRKDLLVCTPIICIGRKQIICFCHKHGVKITSLKLVRKFNLQSWWNWTIYPLWKNRSCK